MAKRPLLFLIDGHAVAYRQHHALGKNMLTANGQPVGATFGFTRTILNVLKRKPQYLAMTFDRGLSGREKLYPAYKANRSEMPDTLILEMPWIEKMVEAFNIPLLMLDGYEADDVIGTVARQAVERGCDVLIISGDRDLLQLLSPHVQVQLPNRTKDKQAGDEIIWNEKLFVEEYQGMLPTQLIDYKGLVGDNSDNIPGIKGIGEKTAPPLLLKFNSVENLFNHLDEINNAKLLAKLEGQQEIALLSKQLATIQTDLPIQWDLKDCHPQDFDIRIIVDLFNELNFISALRQDLRNMLVETGNLEALAILEAIEESEIFVPPHSIIQTEAHLEQLARKLNTAKLIAVDTETTGLDKMQAGLVGISLSMDGEMGYYIPVGHTRPATTTQSGQMNLFPQGETPQQLSLEQVVTALEPVLTNPNIPKVAHNAGYDLVILRRHGLDITPISDDTMLAEFVINPERSNLGLKRLAWERLRLKMREYEDIVGKGKKQLPLEELPVEKVAAYASADAVATFKLLQVVQPLFDDPAIPKAHQVYEALEVPLIPVLANMEMAGVKIDLPYLRTLAQEFEGRLADIADQVYGVAGKKFLINSPKQLSEVLFGHMGLSPEGVSKTKTGDYSLTGTTLEELSERESHPIFPLIMDYRSLQKLQSTYVEALSNLVNPATKRVHTSYNQTGAITGRLSSNNPNLQNIPIRTEEGRRVRRAFIAEAGRLLLSVDYSQIELRILAHYSDDDTLKQAFAQGEDIHRATAAKVFKIPLEQVTYEQRRFAKTVNFGLMYGMGSFRLARQSDFTLSEANRFIEEYFDNFPSVKNYLEATKQFAKENGYVQTLFGRRRYFPELKAGGMSFNSRTRAEREAINTPIQGTAADIMKKAMIALDKELRQRYPQTALMLQVHDELVLEVPEDQVEAVQQLVVEIMEAAGDMLSVPVVAEAHYGTNWAELDS